MTTNASSSQSLFNKMVRAAQLDINLYEAVEADKGANLQAFLVVVLASLASGLGIVIKALIADSPRPLWVHFLIGFGIIIVGWLLWSLVIYIVGIAVFKGPETEADYGQLLRTIGFSNSPGVLRFFSFIPFIGFIIVFVASVWTLIAGVIAVRQALDFSTWRAIGTCLIGWLIYILVLFLIPGWIIGRSILY